MTKEWFILRVAPNAPRYLKRWLPAIGIDEVHQFTHRRKRRRKPPITLESFPGYLFVRFDLDQRYWRELHTVHGVIGLLGVDAQHPMPLGPNVMSRLIADHEKIFTAEDVARLGRLMKGIVVRITHGPLTDLAMIVDSDNGINVHGHAMMFGGATLVSVRRQDVTPV